MRRRLARGREDGRTDVRTTPDGEASAVGCEENRRFYQTRTPRRPWLGPSSHPGLGDRERGETQSGLGGWTWRTGAAEGSSRMERHECGRSEKRKTRDEEGAGGEDNEERSRSKRLNCLNLTSANYFKVWARNHRTRSVLSRCHAKLVCLLFRFLL